jgi:hypothetical protein
MKTAELLRRLAAADPGWTEWAGLVALAESLPMRAVTVKHVGTFLTARGRLTFAAPGRVWPGWVPPYVAALDGLKAANPDMAGGYADAFTGRPTSPGKVFNGSIPDASIGLPALAVPPGCYPFQFTPQGTLVHLTDGLEVLFPDANNERLSPLGSLEAFTRANIRQAVAGEPWAGAYPDLPD